MARRTQAARIKIVGWDEFERGLRKFNADLNDLTRLYVKVATYARDRARAAAPSRLSPGIQKSARPEGAFVNVIHRPPDALGRIMGANRRFGWYAAPQFKESRGRQFEKWVGNDWDPGSESGKPYYIGDALNSAVTEIIEIFGEEIMDMSRPAFPLGGLSR